MKIRVEDVGGSLLEEPFEPRKAFFQKSNRSGVVGKRRRYKAGLHKRGNSFVGRTFSQRVLVKAHYKKHKIGGGSGGASGGGVGNLKGHLNYITRKGAGAEKDEKAILFSAEFIGENELSKSDFYAACENDRHHFRFIISPENGDEIDDMQNYVCRVMERVKGDLDTKLEWVSAVHYDTENPHAHVIVRGKDERGQDLVIAGDYIGAGIRGRAQEVANELLGERSLEEVQKSMEGEIGALRVTSLDRYIENNAVEEILEDDLETSKSNVLVFDASKVLRGEKGVHFDGLIEGRLKYLVTTGLATEAQNIYQLRADFASELRERAQTAEITAAMEARIPDEMDKLHIYRVSENNTKIIEGRVESVGYQDEISDQKYLLVRDGDENIHHVAMAMNNYTDSIVAGVIVRVSAPTLRKNGADFNIAEEAKANNGIYDPELHKASVYERQLNMKSGDRGYIDDVESYIGNHLTRIETLEKADIGRIRDNGNYVVPDDLVEQGAAYNAKMDKKYRRNLHPQIKVISPEPLDSMVEVEARTFLDLEIWRHQKGYNLGYDHADKKTLDTLSRRKEWLEQNGYASYNSNDGAFLMKDDAMKRLYQKELDQAKQKLGKGLGRNVSDFEIESPETIRFYGFANLHAGHHAIITRGDACTIVKTSQNTVNWRRGEPLEFTKDKGQFVFERDMAHEKKSDALKQFGKYFKMETKELDIEAPREIIFLGAVNLKDSAYAVIEHGGKVSMLKTKEYPVLELQGRYTAVQNEKGFAELEGISRQEELSFSRSQNAQDKDRGDDIEMEL